MTTKTTNQPASSLVKTLAIEIAVPTGVYYALHSLGVSDFAALAVSGVSRWPGRCSSSPRTARSTASPWSCWSRTSSACC